jgi:hypothetical protein
MKELRSLAMPINPPSERIETPPWQRIYRFALAAWIFAVLSLALTATGLLSGCGGGGSSSSNDSGDLTVNALSLPNRIELTKVQDSSDDSNNLTSKGKHTGISGYKVMISADDSVYNADGTDYNALVRQSWGEDMAESLSIVNEILEVVKDTGYDKMVNEEAYVALVNTPGDDKQSEGGGATTATVTEQLSEMTVKVERANNSSPMYVYFWLSEEDMGPGSNPGLVKGRFEVTHGVDDDYPMGEMTAYILGKLLDDNGNETDDPPIMKIALSIASENGQAVVEFVEENEFSEQGYNMVRSSEMRVVADNDFQIGNAYVYEEEPDWDNMHSWGAEPDYEINEMQVAFNSDYVKIDENGEIFVFDKNDLDHEVHRYKLFDAEGDTVDINSGFPIKFPEENAYGYVSYYGMWAPDNLNIGAETTVRKEGSDEEYTLIQKPGKLIKHSKTSKKLSQLANTEMFRWNSNTGEDDIITWKNGEFKKIGTRGESTNWNPEYLQTPVTIATLEEWEGAWCDALQAYLPLGQLFVNGTPSDSSLLTYHEQKTMIPGKDNFPPKLYQYGPGIDENDWDYDWENPERHQYTYDTTNFILKENGSEVVYSGDDWGRELMPLTEADVQDAWNEETYYSWVSGKDQWAKLTILLAAENENAPVSFDPPLRLSYTHETGYDYNYDSNDPNNDKFFSMEYDGFELRIPWIYDEDEDEWMPQVNLKDSHVSGITLAGDDGKAYVLKGWEEELKMTEVAQSDPNYTDIVASLDTDSEIDPPEIVDTMDAAIEELFSDTTTWQRPTNVEVKIIKGELIEE